MSISFKVKRFWGNAIREYRHRMQEILHLCDDLDREIAVPPVISDPKGAS